MNSAGQSGATHTNCETPLQPLLWASGVPLEHISKALGHDSIKTTFKTTEKAYAKWIRDRQILVVNSLAASWGRQRKLVGIEAGRKGKMRAVASLQA